MSTNNEFGVRLRALRTMSSKSQKAMALDIGTGQSTYASWETGRTVPNATSLAAICRLGANMNWFLTGEGTPLIETKGDKATSASQLQGSTDGQRHDAYPPSTVMPQDLTLREELRNLRETGLDQLFLLSQRGSQSGLWRVLKALSSAGTQLSLTELHRIISVDGEPAPTIEHVAADAKLLVLQSQIEEIERDNELHYEMVCDAKLYPSSHADMLQSLREAIRSLGTKILPAIQQRDKSGWLANGEWWVPNGKDFIAKLRTLLLEEISNSRGVGERVYVVLAAGVETETSSDKPGKSR